MKGMITFLLLTVLASNAVAVLDLQSPTLVAFKEKDFDGRRGE